MQPNVRSTPLPSAKTKDSAVITRAQLRRQRGAIERALAFAVLFVSFFGSVVWLSGGLPALFSKPTITAIVGGLALQGLLTFLQWHYFDRPLIAWGARVFDAYTTALGYGPLVLPLVVGALQARGVADTFWVAWAIIGVASLVIAWYPESRLVD